MYKMNKGFLKKWINALRNTEYKQIRYNLCLDGSYCAIGIACKEVMNVKDVHMYNKGEISDIIGCVEIYRDQELFKIKFGNDGYNKYIHNKLLNQVARLNDSKKYSFYDISVWLETNVEGI
tara:strand:+ start:272 stop:634 length:363 start_codon:yes stop_codon:yes gene_type:complete